MKYFDMVSNKLSRNIYYIGLRDIVDIRLEDLDIEMMFDLEFGIVNDGYNRIMIDVYYEEGVVFRFFVFFLFLLLLL